MTKAEIMKLADWGGYPFGSMSSETSSVYRAAKDENARLLPLIEALAASNEALVEALGAVESRILFVFKDAQSPMTGGVPHTVEYFRPIYAKVSKALADHAERMKRLAGGE